MLLIVAAVTAICGLITSFYTLRVFAGGLDTEFGSRESLLAGSSFGLIALVLLGGCWLSARQSFRLLRPQRADPLPPFTGVLYEPGRGIDSPGFDYLGRGPAAVGTSPGWVGIPGLHYRCANCGDWMSASRRDSFTCTCNGMHLDVDVGRFGSRLGEGNVLVYREVVSGQRAGNGGEIEWSAGASASGGADSADSPDIGQGFRCFCGSAMRIFRESDGITLSCRSCGRWGVIAGWALLSSITIRGKWKTRIIGAHQGSGETVARAPVDFIHYIKCHPWQFLGPIASIMVGSLGLLGFLFDEVALLVFGGVYVGGGALFAAANLLRASIMFQEGTVCPAVVVAAAPWRVAVWANMSKHAGEQADAIRIVRLPLEQAMRDTPRVGQRLAAVVGFERGREVEVADDFVPRLLVCGTRDEPTNHRVRRSLSLYEWAELDWSLRKIFEPKEGLYKLWRDGKAITHHPGKGKITVATNLAIMAMPALAIPMMIIAYLIRWYG